MGDARLIATPIKKILCLQALIVISISTIILLLKGWVAAQAALVGGCVAWLPNVITVGWLLSQAQGSAQRFLIALYVGEALKLLLIGMLFAAVLYVGQFELKLLLIGFVGAFSVYWFALIFGRDVNVD